MNAALRWHRSQSTFSLTATAFSFGAVTVARWQHPLARWPLLFAAWTLLGLSFAAQFYIASGQVGAGVSWRQAVGGALGDWYVFAALSWPALKLARRFPFTRANWARSLTWHVLGALLFSLAFMFLRAAVAQWQGWAAGQPVAFAAALRPLLVKTWHFNLMIYAVIVGVTQAAVFYQESQARARRALELEKRLAEARLQALQMQLNPHFLFNALNAIATLIHRDVDRADRMLVRLAELLRLTLDNTATQEVTLREELALLERYLDIERVRFAGRLDVNIDAPADTLGARVPTLLLQPLVENAVRHGISRHARPGRIALQARREANDLCLEVHDNGDGVADGRPAREGVGLSNTRARLAQLYGAQQQLELGNHAEGGFVARVRLPFSVKPTAQSTV